MITKFNFEKLDLKGAYKIQPFYATDERGGFVKDYNIDMFKANGIEHELKEVFYTISKRGVIRAMHFQLVKQQAKLVRSRREGRMAYYMLADDHVKTIIGMAKEHIEE